MKTMANEVTINPDKITKLELERLERLNSDRQKAIDNWKKMEELLSIIKETEPLNSCGMGDNLMHISAYIKDSQEKTELLPTYILK